MSDVWPPPPQNQPASEPSIQGTNTGNAAISCASTGALMLGLVLFANMHKHLVGLDYNMTPLVIVSGLTLAGLALLNFGGWLGGRTKEAKNGRVAVVLWFAANFLFALFSFLIMYGQDF